MKTIIILTGASLLVSIGCMIFLAPSNLASGGVFGIGVVLNYYLQNLPVGLIMLLINIVLFVIGFIALGLNFGIKTIYTTISLSLFSTLIEIILPLKEPITDDLFIQFALGILLSAVGMAIIFNQNASTGGTDIIAKIINKHTNISIGLSLIITDFIISLSAGLIFGVTVGLYSFLGCLVCGVLIDFIIKNLNKQSHVLIFTQKYNAINKYIKEILAAEGVVINTTSFKGKIVSVVLNTKKIELLRRYIEITDKDSFFVVSDVKEFVTCQNNGDICFLGQSTVDSKKLCS